jgi:hypothetical protein
MHGRVITRSPCTVPEAGVSHKPGAVLTTHRRAWQYAMPCSICHRYSCKQGSNGHTMCQANRE